MKNFSLEFASVCPFGKPLKDAFDQDVICGVRVPCPALFKCVDSETDDSDKMFCCPTGSYFFIAHIFCFVVTGEIV